LADKSNKGEKYGDTKPEYTGRRVVSRRTFPTCHLGYLLVRLYDKLPAFPVYYIILFAIKNRNDQSTKDY